ncbi:hypothetical protein CP985_10340 [Malaciobacter mytili LMG 24559]|uniref:Uncharacterized protein n=1 Tax=Malaciobacter mytili LMG 24559 TaxID=1032238 RepID=A0AAX2AG39_9BACT|nr:hypothetical protein [Malaciobacter mytili]AXH16434.1 hypothetical protein AMYT_a0136 [Malaciobacter mytili LMG 24559]RXK15094.1 hypothetical protein CP985_10340 [Malaciobacter mytili LMG 24559]
MNKGHKDISIIDDEVILSNFSKRKKYSYQDINVLEDIILNHPHIKFNNEQTKLIIHTLNQIKDKSLFNWDINNALNIKNQIFTSSPLIIK